MKQRRKSSSGFSAIETLLAIGIFSFSLLTSISFFSQMNKALQTQKASETRIRLFQKLIYMFGMPATIRASMENDTPSGMLWKSVRNNLVTVPAAPVGISLFLPVLAGDAVSVITSGRISGSPTDPLLYSINNGICNPATSTCDPAIYSITVTTEFLPVCPPAYDYYNGVWIGPIYPTGLVVPTNCNRAQYLKIFYRFAPTPGSPSDLSFVPVTGSIMVNSVLANSSI